MEMPGFFGPLRLPPGTLRHVGSFKHKGRVLMIMRLPVALDPNDDMPLLWEDPMDQLFHCEVVEIKPMKMPSGLIFYQNYVYGDEL
jgi:hypothetical protein